MVYTALRVYSCQQETHPAKENRQMSSLGKAATALLMFSVALAVQAQNPFESAKQFSATVVMTGATPKGHGVQGDMKIYRSGDKMRTTMPGGMGYLVMDLTQHTNYMVMGTGMCMQMSRPTQQNPFSEAQDATIDRSPAGTDTVDGHSCKVENLTVTGHSGQPVKMKVWEADDLHGFPIKIEMQSSNGPMTIEYKDISLAQPDASLFTHPDNCQQMPNMPMPGGPH
jgi:outer membrane lipoprotein-sorting protein